MSKAEGLGAGHLLQKYSQKNCQLPWKFVDKNCSTDPMDFSLPGMKDTSEWAVINELFIISDN